MAHALPSDTGRWIYNDNPYSPTFSPSFRQGMGDGKSCHYFIRDGFIEWCGDSWHRRTGRQKMIELRDKSVDEELSWLD
jgi:hypothetical protein